MALVAGGLDLIAGQDVTCRTAYTGGVVIQIQGDAILLLQLIGIDRTGEMISAVMVSVEVKRLIH